MSNIIHPIQQVDGTFILQLSTGIKFIPRSSIYYAKLINLLPAPEHKVLEALAPIDLPEGLFTVYSYKDTLVISNTKENQEPFWYLVDQGQITAKIVDSQITSIDYFQIMSAHTSFDEIKHFYPEFFI